jgi:hypothetical protein
MQALIIIESNILYYIIIAFIKIKTFKLYKIMDKAIRRGYNLNILKLLLNNYIADKRKPSRPLVLTLNIMQIIKDIVTKNLTIKS